MEINQNSFIHNLYIAILILCIENTFNTKIYQKIQNLCNIRSFINLYYIHQHIYLCAKCVFNTIFMWKCTNLWMEKLHIIFIINSLNFKLVMNIVKNTTIVDFHWFTFFANKKHPMCDHVSLKLDTIGSKCTWVSFEI
jgi:hypothetical protein